MNKSRLLAFVCLCTTVFCLATPVNAMSERVNNPIQPHHQQTVSDNAPAIRGNQAIENNSLFTSMSGISDETWLFCSAMLALAGIIIVHKATH